VYPVFHISDPLGDLVLPSNDSLLYVSIYPFAGILSSYNTTHYRISNMPLVTTNRRLSLPLLDLTSIANEVVVIMQSPGGTITPDPNEDSLVLFEEGHPKAILRGQGSEFQTLKATLSQNRPVQSQKPPSRVVCTCAEHGSDYHADMIKQDRHKSLKAAPDNSIEDRFAQLEVCNMRSIPL